MPHLIAKSMSTDGDGMCPPRNEARDVFTQDRLTENCAAQDVPDGSIGTLPHPLQLKLWRKISSLAIWRHREMLSRDLPHGGEHTLNSGLIRGDGGTLDSHIVLLRCQSRVDGDLVIRLVTEGQTQVKVLQLDVDVRQDELGMHRILFDEDNTDVFAGNQSAVFSASVSLIQKSSPTLFRSSIYLLFDELPYDARHLISVHLHHRLVHLDAPCGI